MKLRLAALLVLVFTCLQAQQKGREHWVATWTTAQLLARAPAAPPAAAPPAAATGIAEEQDRLETEATRTGRRS